jgi:hypothetical protein
MEFNLYYFLEGTNSASGFLKGKFRATSREKIIDDGRYYLRKINELIGSSDLPVYTQHNYGVSSNLI